MIPRARLLARVDEVLPEVRKIRHELHAMPELACKERHTSAFVRERLQSMPVSLRTPLIGTDVVAMLRGAHAGPNVTLRADMDALPILERTGLPYRSRHDGFMHACGHDGHTAVLLGAAMVLGELKNRLRGSVRFVFQPGEEVRAAGRDLVEAGVLTRPGPRYVFALHAWPGIPVGHIMSAPGPLMAAADVFRITVTGKGGHGAFPHLCLNPIPVAAAVVQALQGILAGEHDCFEPAVLSVCRIQAGTNSNIIPPTAVIEGTVRHLDDAVGDRIADLIARKARAVCAGAGARCRVVHKRPYVATVNDKAAYDVGRELAMTLFGRDHWSELAHPVMGAEDFSYFLRQAPGAFFSLGMGTDSARLHTPEFDFNDKALRNGVAFLCGLALRGLEA